MLSAPENLVRSALAQFIIIYCTSTSVAASDIATVQGLTFLRDPSYDDLKVTSDPDGLDLVCTSDTRCASLCAQHSWCTSFFFSAVRSACTLHATVFIAPSNASSSVGTSYYRNVVDWCYPPLARLYNRQAQMCMYLELDHNSRVANWTNADSACANMGMRLAGNLSPLRMDAILNVTKSPALVYSIYIGLWRKWNAANDDLTWVDGQAADPADLQPYWEHGQPNGFNGQRCVVIETHTGKNWLVDVNCTEPHEFVCELLKP